MRQHGLVGFEDDRVFVGVAIHGARDLGQVCSLLGSATAAAISGLLPNSFSPASFKKEIMPIEIFLQWLSVLKTWARW